MVTKEKLSALMDMSNEEIVLLAKKSPDKTEYAHALFEKNRGILTTIAAKMYRNYNEAYNGFIYEIGDYMNIGYEVILIAIDAFHEDKSYLFSTYLERTYSNYVKRKFFMYKSNMTPKDTAYYCSSLNEKMSKANNGNSGDDREIIEVISDDYDILEEAEGRVDTDLLIKNMKEILPEREFQMIYRRYVLGETLTEIGKSYNITRERVRQLTERSLRELKSRLAKKIIA